MPAVDRPPWAGGTPWWASERHAFERHGGDTARVRRTFRIAGAAIVQIPVVVGLALHGDPRSTVAYLVCGLVAVAALGLPQKAAGPAVIVIAVAVAGALSIAVTPPSPLVALCFGLVGAMLHAARPWALVAAALALLAPIVGAVAWSPAPTVIIGLIATGVAVAVSFMAAEGVRVRSRITRDYRAAAEDRRQVIAEQERVRIARELHDVLAHSLSSINVQAGVGLHLMSTQPEAAGVALETIKTASRDALDEVRSVLGVLRDDEGAPRRPAPGLDALPSLIEETVGVHATLDDALRPRPPQPVQFALFRIVQESLTNATRHAAGSTVTVTLSRDGEDSVARIRSAGGAPAPGERGRAGPAPAGRGGRGIVGMRERATLLGGTLDAGPAAGGFEVVARIPSPRELAP